jgi:hypothetical protein
MKLLKRILKWSALAIVLVLFAWFEFAYWTSTNDCDRYITRCHLHLPDPWLSLVSLGRFCVMVDRTSTDEVAKTFEYLFPDLEIRRVCVARLLTQLRPLMRPLPIDGALQCSTTWCV